ncbi:MAG TPA: biotin transporter BioY [Terriglobales bacterium]|nr:biotin transporter BioY [Terriglobales bacterium]
MANPLAEFLGRNDRVLIRVPPLALVVGASLFVACCARLSVPLPFTPVPLSLANFGVLMVGLVLGARRGFAALVLYLVEGAMGLPVFSPTGPGGLAQLVGPTGGFLLAYPLAAAVAGLIAKSEKPTLSRTMAAAAVAELVLFSGGIGWLAILSHSLSQAVRLGLYWFVFAEVIKILAAAVLARGWQGAGRIAE